LALTDALLAACVPIVQLRDKTADGRALLEVAQELRRRTRDAGTLFVVNDRLDIALLAEADGVHVGQDDLPVSDVRRVAAKVGREDLLVGLSTHNVDQVREATTLDVDYLGFGPVFATATKSDALPQRGTEALAAAVTAAGGLPVVAIGGITLGTAAAVATAGASMGAVIGDLVSAMDRVSHAQRLHKALQGRT
jgi:thiamine-phosphate pyrophosphorylase